MDPFSITVGSAALADTILRTTKWMMSFIKGAAQVEGEIASLFGEIHAMDSANQSIRQLHEQHVEGLIECVKEIPTELRKHWETTSVTLTCCCEMVQRFEAVMTTIVGSNGPLVTGRTDGIRKQLRKQDKEEQIGKLRDQIASHHRSLQLCMTTLIIHRKVPDIWVSAPKAATSAAINITDSGWTPAVASQLRLNRYFDIPKSVSSIFTGRKAHLDDLKHAFDLSLSAGDGRTRRRFVVTGISGSGKTQFCCKFAWENKQSFWGVFTIDASSPENARQSLIGIAKMAQVDPNERAAKSWLATSEFPWLLLIDNADDSHLDLERYFPDSGEGLTLITTCFPSNKMHGTIGSRFYQFDRLEEIEASELLLKAADQKQPWTPPIMRSASKIAKTLGALPLALIHAGQAIRARYCQLSDYLSYYDRSWDVIRQSHHLSGNREEGINMEDYLKVYASYEIVYRGLEAMNLLIAAVRYPTIEREAQHQNSSTEKQGRREIDRKLLGLWWRPRPWLTLLHKLVSKVVESILMSPKPTVLPAFLLDAELSNTPDDCHERLHKALYELTQLSLIAYHEATDSYSMHPLVHTWVRERPGMSTYDQAIWCEAAKTVISRCTLLPPLSNLDESHTDLQRHLLPHLISVDGHQSKIQARYRENQKSRRKPWPTLQPEMHPQKALQLVKSSLIYLQGGYFTEAEKRQRIVKDFICAVRGADHPRSIEITLALAGTLWQQSRTNEAAELQSQVLETCLRTLRPDHPQTLKVMDCLGHSRRQQDAKRQQTEAVAGLRRLLGAADLRTLSAMEGLAITCMELGIKHMATSKERGEQYLAGAHRDISFVLEERQRQLGDMQPFTWLAKANFAPIKSAMGKLNEAENLISTLVPIAVAHLGEDHMGVLAGKTHLAAILIKQGRFTEAEELLLDISKPENYLKTSTASGEHPDRCQMLWTLVECYQKQDKFVEGLRVCEELLAAVNTMRRDRKQTATSGIFWQMVQNRKRELEVAYGVFAAGHRRPA
ncbi:uncharacterized protein KD926_005488 [Aspergillus affinis]|uniref:uncharacterized protein n=1 Tax=Aspergillus affinis TaxID=1070780 RepID=UPI0022FE21F9|nr:uncharacterized protein KD926_005488 [Aspergillus affinis]KAI9042410.1 hypothetical protein KD926_005488 [Aspergillus affinis]